MKTHFALLLPLLPSITQGKHVNLRGAILQDEDEPKSTRRLLDCLPFDEAFAYYLAYVDPSDAHGVNCRSHTECSGGQSCLVAMDYTGFFCGIPNDQDYVLCDDEDRTDPVPTEPQPVPTEPQPSPTSPPPPPPTTSLPTMLPPTPPPVDTCLPFNEAFAYYIAYVDPEDAHGVNCRSHTECSGGQSCLVAMDYTSFFCGIPNGQVYVLCDDDIGTDPVPTEPQPVPTEPQPSPTSPPPPPPPTTSPPTTPPPTPPPVSDGNRDDTDPPSPSPSTSPCLPFDEAYVYYYTYVKPQDARGVNCRSHAECTGGQSCLVAKDYTMFFCGIPNGQDYVLCD